MLQQHAGTHDDCENRDSVRRFHKGYRKIEMEQTVRCSQVINPQKKRRKNVNKNKTEFSEKQESILIFYKQKSIELCGNLKQNKGICVDILNGNLSGEKLIKMDSNELATKDTQLKRHLRKTEMKERINLKRLMWRWFKKSFSQIEAKEKKLRPFGNGHSKSGI